MKVPTLRLLLPLCCLAAATMSAQQPAPAAPKTLTQSLTYLKIAPGKGSDFLKMTREETMKVSQVRADAGEIVSWTLLRSVYPAGEESRADYLISVITEGAPPKPGGNSKLEADLKKAGVAMTTDEYWAKRQGVSTRVSQELWNVRERVGAPAKGHYVFINMMRVHDYSAYLDFEKNVWRPLAEGWVKEGVLSGWICSSRILPGGDDQPYQVFTADMFPTWEAAFANRGDAFQAMFAKVHPGKKANETMDGVTKLRSMGKRELWVVVERVTKSAK